MIIPQLDLRQRLVRKAARHDEAGVARATTQVDQSTLRQHQQALAIGELNLVHLRLDVVPLVVAQGVNLDLAVKVANVAHNGAILHGTHVLKGNDVHVARCRHEDVAQLGDIVHRVDLIAFQRGLQGTDRINFGDDHARACRAQRCSRALADIAITGNDGNLASHHHISGAADAVNQALATAVQVVKLALGDAVIHVDGRNQQLTLLGHFNEAMHARGGFLADALHVL